MDNKGSAQKQTNRDSFGSAIAVLAVLGLLAVVVVESYNYFTVYRPSHDCEALKVQLQADVLCRVSDDCTFTRDELDAYRQRVIQYNANCDPDEPLTVGM